MEPYPVAFGRALTMQATLPKITIYKHGSESGFFVGQGGWRIFKNLRRGWCNHAFNGLT
jgi:hypothetical protein